MMLLTKCSLVQLGWMLIFILPFTHSQLTNGGGTPETEANFKQRLNNGFIPKDDDGEDWDMALRRTQSVAKVQSTTKPTTLRHAIPSPETIAALSTLPEESPTAATSFMPLMSSLRAAIPSPDPDTLASTATATSNQSASPRSGSAALASTSLLTSTVTVSTTVVVLPSPPPVSNEASLPSVTNDAASEKEPLVSAISEPMSAGAQLGMGVGITFSVLTLAGVVGIYIWRRRRNLQHGPSNAGDESHQPSILAKVFNMRKHKDNKDDPEWSIESVEKVSIMKNMRAHSVSTVSRSNSRGSDVGNEAGTIPIMMAKQSMALTSHPMTPSYSVFPAPPGRAQMGTAKMVDIDEEGKAPGNWPIKD